MFKKAERKKSKLRLALLGPSGSGKTYGALLIAKGIGGKIAVIDTENGSSSLYSEEFDFDVINMPPPYSPDNYISLIKEAEKSGYDTLIIDSATHEWTGSGGCIEMNEQIAKNKFGGNTWSAWSSTKSHHRKFIDSIIQSNLHIIVTARTKTESAQQEGSNGKKKVVKLGMKVEQMDGFEYEFTVVIDMLRDGNVGIPSKDRTKLFKDEYFVISEETGKMLVGYLNSGKDIDFIVDVKSSREEIESAINEINSSESIDSLKEIFAKHYKGFSKDEETRLKIKLAYDDKKMEMECLNEPV